MVKTRNQKRKESEVDQVHPLQLQLQLQKKQKLEDYDCVIQSDSESESDCEESYLSDSDTDTEQLSKLILKEIFKKITKTDKKENDNDKEEGYLELVDSIYSGDFFYDSKKNEIDINQSKLEELREHLKNIQNDYYDDTPDLKKILESDLPLLQKKKLVEVFYKWNNSEILSSDWTKHSKTIKLDLNKDNSLLELENSILKRLKESDEEDDYKTRVLKSKMSFENKVKVYSKIDIMESYSETDSGEYTKYKTWVDLVLNIPFGKYNENTELDLSKVREILDNKVAYMEKPKDQILNLVAHKQSNSEYKLNAIGLYGEKGLGKTRLVSAIAESLGRPFSSISLGGESDSSLLNGHNFTYVGSTPGRIIESIIRNKCMDSVILFDELDKVSESHHGKEIIGTLIHLTDSTTNSEYNYDRYFSGIKFDLSKTLFVFTYNDPSKIDPILLDRIYKIKIDDYKPHEKFEITNNYILKDVLENFKFTKDQIHFNKDTLQYIINMTSTTGMRDISQKLYIIVSRINTLLRNHSNVIKLKYNKLSDYYSKLPVIIPKEHVDILLEDSTETESLPKVPFGMYI
jgi:ATP-dependent Lon protease